MREKGCYRHPKGRTRGTCISGGDAVKIEDWISKIWPDYEYKGKMHNSVDWGTTCAKG